MKLNYSALKGGLVALDQITRTVPDSWGGAEFGALTVRRMDHPLVQRWKAAHPTRWDTAEKRFTQRLEGRQKEMQVLLSKAESEPGASKDVVLATAKSLMSIDLEPEIFRLLGSSEAAYRLALEEKALADTAMAAEVLVTDWTGPVFQDEDGRDLPCDLHEKLAAFGFEGWHLEFDFESGLVHRYRPLDQVKVSSDGTVEFVSGVGKDEIKKLKGSKRFERATGEVPLLSWPPEDPNSLVDIHSALRFFVITTAPEASLYQAKTSAEVGDFLGEEPAG